MILNDDRRQRRAPCDTVEAAFGESPLDFKISDLRPDRAVIGHITGTR